MNKDFPEGTLNRNIRDVLAHLHYWHILLLGWYNVGMTGEKPEMPAKGYRWNQTPALNKMINDIYKSTGLKEVRQKLNSSYDAVMQIIHKHSNEELFTKGIYKWTGSTSLGVYITANTSSHYAWAIRLIRKAKK